MARKPKTRPEQCCFNCRHWSGRPERWREVGQMNGICVWLVNLVVTHASIGIPDWVTESRPVRMTYDTDGAECAGWAASLSDEAG